METALREGSIGFPAPECVSEGMWRRIGMFTQHVSGEISVLSPTVFAPFARWEQRGPLGQTTRAQPLAEPPPNVS